MKKVFFLCLASIPLLSLTVVAALANPAKGGFTKLPANRSFTKLSPVAQEQALEKELALLENRFFFHGYAQDPLPKRLERLELLVLGTTQPGVAQERLAKLKVAIVEKDKYSAQSIAREMKEASKSDYPVLSTLEWRILKKTYVGGALDERLARMEKHLFGLPSEAMSYADRIERLKKTVGLATPDVAQVPGKRVLRPNLMPRDGRSNNGIGMGTGQGFHQKFSGKTPDGNGFYSFEFHSSGPGEGFFNANPAVPNIPFEGGRGMTVPGFPFDSSSGGAAGNFAQLWQKMNQDMEEMMEDFPDTPRTMPLIPRFRQHALPPNTGQGSSGSGAGGGLRGGGGSGSFYSAPGAVDGTETKPGQVMKKPKSFLSPREDLPPYLDPNSI